MTAKNRKLLAFFAAVVLIAVISGAIIYTYNANRVPDAPEILPDSGLLIPFRQRKKVDFPQPFPPITATFFPLRMFKLK